MKMIFVWCSLFWPIACFSQSPPMTEYFKWKVDPVVPVDPGVVVLEPFQVLSGKTDEMSPAFFRELDEVFKGKSSSIAEVSSHGVGLATFPESPRLDGVLENFLPSDLWVKIHGGIKVGDATFYIHSGISWKVDKWTEFIFPLFQGGIHGPGFGWRKRF